MLRLVKNKLFRFLGHQLFGSKMNSSVTLLLAENGIPENYIYNSFNDFG
jgi:hypothetical protein